MTNLSIPIAEIFGPTIQGEGSKVGVKTLFVRVTGCDFKCEWCDSKFAWKVNKDTKFYTEMELINEILSLAMHTSTKNVVFTGGNPCLYDALKKVTKVLKKQGLNIDIETQGSILPKWLNSNINTLVISPKAPSSKQKDVKDIISNYMENNKDFPENIIIKIPIFNDEDFEFAKSYYNLITQNKSFIKNKVKLYLSVGNTDVSEPGDISSRVLNDYKNLIDKVLKSSMEEVYILPQMHTLIYGNKQGV